MTHSARMSKITTDGLTRSGTGWCFLALPIWQVSVKGLRSFRAFHISCVEEWNDNAGVDNTRHAASSHRRWHGQVQRQYCLRDGSQHSRESRRQAGYGRGEARHVWGTRRYTFFRPRRVAKTNLVYNLTSFPFLYFIGRNWLISAPSNWAVAGFIGECINVWHYNYWPVAVLMGGHGGHAPPPWEVCPLWPLL